MRRDVGFVLAPIALPHLVVGFLFCGNKVEQTGQGEDSGALAATRVAASTGSSPLETRSGLSAHIASALLRMLLDLW